MVFLYVVSFISTVLVILNLRKREYILTVVVINNILSNLIVTIWYFIVGLHGPGDNRSPFGLKYLFNDSPAIPVFVILMLISG